MPHPTAFCRHFLPLAIMTGCAAILCAGCDRSGLATPVNPSPSGAIGISNPPLATQVESPMDGTAPLPDRSDPDDVANQAILDAQGLVDAKNWPAALERYQKAAALSPKNEEIHFRLGICHVALGNLEAAEKDYRTAVQLFPDYAEAHNNLGSLLVRQGHLTEGIEHIRTALANSPQSPKAHNNLGMALAKQGNLGGAIAEFQESTRLDPNSAEVWVNLANAYLLQHRYAEAAEPLRTALRLHPEFPPAIKAQARLTTRMPSPR